MLTVDEISQYGYAPNACFPPVSPNDLERAESELGFGIPPLLQSIYLEVTNGISGFCYQIMGLANGCESHFGNLIDTYKVFVEDEELSGRNPWKRGLLPFCSWGDNIFSCVDCMDPKYIVSTYESEDVWPQTYSVSDFFDMWLMGVDILAQEKVETEARKAVNPFTGQEIVFRARKRNKRT